METCEDEVMDGVSNERRVPSTRQSNTRGGTLEEAPHTGMYASANPSGETTPPTVLTVPAILRVP